MKILKNLLAPLATAIMFTGCASTPAVDAQPSFSVCIVSGEDASDGPTADYMGHTVNFCCDRCKSKWEGMDAAAQDAAWNKLTK